MHGILFEIFFDKKLSLATFPNAKGCRANPPGKDKNMRKEKIQSKLLLLAPLYGYYPLPLPPQGSSDLR